MSTTPVLIARSKLGVATRSGDINAVRSARRDLAAANLEQYIERVVSDAPPLTSDQRDRIAALLGGGA
ncbi:hypothetical protein [uncultured Salinibacterium sp.]|uniref:hypothetical protein n=1 Tax=uncultured Salinibacterium sp. TaxID=459274 RepID=UPI0030DC9D71